MPLSPVLCSSQVLRAEAPIHQECRAAAPGQGYTKTRECLKHSLDLAQRELLLDLCRKRTLRAPPATLLSSLGCVEQRWEPCCSRRWLHRLGTACAEERVGVRMDRLLCAWLPPFLTGASAQAALPTGHKFISKSYPLKCCPGYLMVCNTAPRYSLQLEMEQFWCRQCF